MKALTIRQPWASLIACGVKTIETRSWSTRYRGPIAIHAGKVGVAWAGGDGWLYPDDYGLLSQSNQYGAVRRPIRPPLGAVVATATLADVVPIRLTTDPPDDWRLSVEDDDAPTPGQWVGVHEAALTLYRYPLRWGSECEHVGDQFPFGDFTAGRFAWLLTDIVRLDDPLPAKGKQGLWEFTDAGREAIT